MTERATVLDHLMRHGISRRAFMKFCAVTTSALALTPRQSELFAQTLAATPRPSVLWLSFQECTGCTESLTRSFDPTLETLILNQVSLDYHHTLQAASGTAAEDARKKAMADFYGKYVLVVDGSVPAADGGAWSTIGGVSNLSMLDETVQGAALVIAVGNCASFGGLAKSSPNPSQAAGIGDLMIQGLIPQRPLVNVPGCPPVPEVIGGVIAYYLVYTSLPALDTLGRPSVYYGRTVHESCTRLAHFNQGEFAQSFDDDGARKGYCLLLLGCKGPVTYNACTTVKWNGGTSFPMYSGHGCLGCSEPDFWDRTDPTAQKGFYVPL